MPIRTAFASVRALGGLIALTAALSAASIAVCAQQPEASSPLTRAKTIQVREKFYVADKEWKLHPYFNVVVQIERPGKIRIDVTPLFKQGGKPLRKSLYLSDGTTEYEYNSLTNQYRTSSAPAPGERSKSQLWAMAAIVPLLYPGQAPPASWHAVRTVGKETLDGREMIVTTDAEPTRNSFTKLWTDAATGLPYRKTDFIKIGDKTVTNLQLDLKDYVLDKPIDAKQFVWAVPAGAEAYTGPKLLAVGTPAPDFAAVTPEGKAVHLSDFKGKTVVLDFWATWCGPCQRSLPHLQKVYEQVKDRGVTVLAVCVWDKKPEYDKWIGANKRKFTFPTAFDPAGRGPKNIAGSLYSVTGIPTQYVIDKEGKIAAGYVGYEEGTYRLETALNRLGIAVPIPAKKTASAQ